MRRVAAIPMALATAAIGLGLFAPTQASAGCIGPAITVAAVAATPVQTDPQARDFYSVAPGQSLTVDGTYFFVGCDDEGGGSGCSGPRTERVKADRDVPLVLEQGGRSWTLGTADADDSDSYVTRWEVTLPADLQPGAATLTARSAKVLLAVE